MRIEEYNMRSRKQSVETPILTKTGPSDIVLSILNMYKFERQTELGVSEKS